MEMMANAAHTAPTRLSLPSRRIADLDMPVSAGAFAALSLELPELDVYEPDAQDSPHVR